jgi:Ser/Thr protein kinase RdoA (MazF antagonist)
VPPASDPALSDAAAVGRFLKEYRQHGLDPAAVRRLAGSVHGESVTYHVAPDGEPPWVLRAYRIDAPVPAQFSGRSAELMTDWVTGRAATLAALEQAAYPAPRPVPVRSGELAGLTGPWITWATTYADGPLLHPDHEQLRLLGANLGLLHVTRAQDQPAVGQAAWHPADAVATTLARLDAVASHVPPQWQDLHAACRATTLAVERAAPLLPITLIHGDAWAGHAVQHSPSEVMLIDWETAGLGLPVLDLGSCLAECHLDSGLPPDRPEAWLIQPDELRIAAVAGGYSAFRVLTPGERALLPDAVRFGAAFLGAIHLSAALIGGASGPDIEARLARLRNRLSISDTVAQLALRYLPT